MFALGDNPLFYAAESTNFVTTGTSVSYALTLRAAKSTLTANGTSILSGRVRNYMAFSGPVNPYETPNYLFLRDNTTSAAAAFKLRQVALAAPAPGVVTWTGVSNQVYTVQGSTNLVSWITLGTATSVKDAFAFTNSPAVAGHFFEWCCRDRATGQITRLFVHG